MEAACPAQEHHMLSGRVKGRLAPFSEACPAVSSGPQCGPGGWLASASPAGASVAGMQTSKCKLLFGQDKLSGAGDLQPVDVPAVSNDDHAPSGHEFVAGDRTKGVES